MEKNNPMPRAKVAVVILNWNGCQMLRTFLPAVIKHTLERNVEIWVADNGSTDESEKLLEKEFPSVRTLVLNRNYGFAEGYNRALKQIDAEYFVLLNSDVEVTPHWLTPLLAYMEEHPEVAACQPKILSYKNREEFEYAGAAGGFIDRYGYPFCRGRIFDDIEPDSGQYEEVCPVFWASGAALFIRACDYWEVGGLDGRFFAHMEEIDLCWRLRSRGRKIVCVPQSVVYHVGGATLQKTNPKKTFLNFRNNLLLLYKNLPEGELKPVMRRRAFLDYLAALVFWLKGKKEDARAVLQARKEFKAIRPEFEGSRRENKRKALETDIPERKKISILWQYYGRGRKRFSDL